MGNANLKWCALIVLYICVLWIEGAFLTDGNGNKPSKLNGKKLREKGVKLRLPML
jgi:hypothetical protein